MPPTLGAAFDASVNALRAATRAVPVIPEPGQVRTLLFQAQEFFASLRTYPETFARDAAQAPGPGSFMNRALADIRAHFAVAERHLADALHRVLIISGPAGEPAAHLQAAATHLAVSRDLIGTHRGPDGEPLTPYLYLLADARAQRYVFFRVTDLAWELGHFMERLAEISYAPGVRGDLHLARQALHRAVVLGRGANVDHMVEFGELTTAPALAVDHAREADLPGTLEHVAVECDRVIRAVFQARHTTGRPLSGADLRQIARSQAHGHLITGRLLLHLAERQPAELGEQLRCTAGGLREAAQAWQLVTSSFRRIVDVTDPREHPALPRFNDIDVRSGQVTLMPRTGPHPATISARAASLRIGQLVYGAGWDPAQPPPQPRLADDILNNTAGLGPLLRDLHRLPALGQHLAQAAPHLLDGIRHNLVTGTGRHYAFHTTRQIRWGPLPARHLDNLLGVFHTAAADAQRAARTMAAAATMAGADTPRARLDAFVRHLVTRGSPEVPGAVARTPLPALPAARRDDKPSRRLAHEHPAGRPSPHNSLTRHLTM